MTSQSLTAILTSSTETLDPFRRKRVLSTGDGQLLRRFLWLHFLPRLLAMWTLKRVNSHESSERNGNLEATKPCYGNNKQSTGQHKHSKHRTAKPVLKSAPSVVAHPVPSWDGYHSDLCSPTQTPHAHHRKNAIMLSVTLRMDLLRQDLISDFFRSDVSNGLTDCVHSSKPENRCFQKPIPAHSDREV